MALRDLVPFQVLTEVLSHVIVHVRFTWVDLDLYLAHGLKLKLESCAFVGFRVNFDGATHLFNYRFAN